MVMKVRLATCLACCLLAVVAGAARQSGRPSGSPDLKAEQRKREVRETMLRTLELGAAVDKKDRKRIEAAIKQVREDFREIQVARNDIARAVLADKPLDYKFISGEAGEVNKRAGRLKTHLLPPIADEGKKDQESQIEFDGAEMKDALARLCKLIDSFVENPVLKTPGLVDVEESTRAGGDLLSIIELSGNIKRSAERLNKKPK